MDGRVFGTWQHFELESEFLDFTSCDMPFFYDVPLEFRQDGEMVNASGNVFEYSFPDDSTIRFTSALADQEFRYKIGEGGSLVFAASGGDECLLVKA